jgi:hypothetical protein
MRHDPLTFGLAFVGYALLAVDAALRVRGRCSASRTALAAAVILAHVLCVWTFRFDWSFARMWAKSPAAFLLFHAALLLIVAAVPAREPWRSRLVVAGFAIVCAGALPAPFRYEELALLRVPMVAMFVAAVWLAVRPADPDR